ncbi:MAG TPA: hypothetical protein VN769_08590 [Xanthobacteraceae bacterium]|nr:hypothetical protein [Xanthobacteraceae bacterium]
MFELHFPPPHRADEHMVSVRRIIGEILEAQLLRGNRAANQAVIDKIGLDVMQEKDEDYCREAIDYHLGILYAYVRDTEKAADHFARSGTYPSSGGFRPFPDHQSDSFELRRRQDLARERGIPSLFITAMARSGSASLVQTLATTLDVPIMRISSHRQIVPRWLQCFARGGAILHDHFGALPYNLKTLRENGVGLVFVRARDPRAAAASAVGLSNRKFGPPEDIDYESQVIRLCEQNFIPWVAGWIAAQSDLKIHWLLEPSSAVPKMAREVLAVLAPEYPALERYLSADVAEVRANFITGDQDAWRRQISPRGQDRLWDAMPIAVRELLELRR